MSAHSQTKGKHGAAARDSAAKRGLSHEAIKLLKTQDAGYLRTTGERIRRQIEKLEQEVRLQEGIQEALGEKKDETEEEEDDDDDFEFDFGPEEKRGQGQRKARKLVFADDRREQRALKKRRLSQENDQKEDEDEDKSFGELQKQQLKKSRRQLEAERQALVEARRARKMKKRAAEARENKLKALRKQYADITAAERELDWQRGRMDNSVGGTNKDGIKWKIRERKK